MKIIYTAAIAILTATTITAGAKEPATLLTSQQHKPFSFIENKGQIIDQYGNYRSDIDYKLQAGKVTVFVGDEQLHYVWSEQSRNDSFNFYRLDVKLMGANKNVPVLKEGQQAYYENYYLPQCPNGVTANSYSKITYKNVYPNIDWVIYTAANAKSLKYDFIVHPGGNPADIKLQYNGATKLEIVNGELTATTPFGSITEDAPYSYYESSTERINSNFVLNGNILSYAFNGSKSPSGDLGVNPKSLIIDPRIDIDWASYYGGSGGDDAGVISDYAGNAYLTGGTTSTSNIAISGAYQVSYAGGLRDGFIAKFNTNCQIQWATYFGGSGSDGFSKSVFTGTDNLWVTGVTNSTGLATSTTHQGSFGGGWDGLIARFNASGTLQWASYYGGSDTDYINSITADAAGNVYIAGYTESSNNIASSGSLSGLSDGFLAKFNAAGVRLWGLYYGGGSTVPQSQYNERFTSVACDNSGNVYAGGETVSTGIATFGAHQTSYGGGASDGLLVKFNSSGSLQWATYYGGNDGINSGLDGVFAVACDNNGNVYIGGYTNTISTGIIATSGTFQSVSSGADAFVVKFNGGGVRQWGTYLSFNLPGVNSLVSDASGNIWAGGTSNGSTTALATADGYHTTKIGPYDGFIMQFNSSTGTRLYGTYIGGSGSNNREDINKLAFSPAVGKLYFSGTTPCSSGIAVNGYQNSIGGNDDAFFGSFILDTMAYIPLPYTDTLFCAGDSIHVPYSTNYAFNSSNSFQLQLSNAAGSFAAPTVIGTRTDVDSGIIHGRLPVTANGTGYRIRIVATNPVRISANDSANIHIKPLPAVLASSNTPVCEGDTIRLFGAGTTGVTWAWSGPLSFSATTQNAKTVNSTSSMAGDYILAVTLNGCVSKDTETVVVKPLPDKPVASSNTPLCTGATLSLTATIIASGVTWGWTGPSGFAATTQSTSRGSMTTTLAGDYIVTATLNGCIAKDTETVVVYPTTPAPIAGSNSPVCVGADINLTASNVTGATYSWTGPSFTSSSQNPTITPATTANAGTYTVIATANGCPSSASTATVTVSPGPTVFIYPSPNDSICQGKLLTLTAIPNPSGSGTGYQWYMNGSAIIGATNVSYSTSNANNGDVFYVKLTPSSSYACTTPVNSVTIPITVLQYQTPSVTIAASDTVAWPGVLINFIATPNNGGAAPTYQWKINGKNVTGATSDIWGTTTLQDGDSVSVEMTSNYICPSPQKVSAYKKIHIATAINSVNNDKLHIYPNPAHNELNIEGISKGTAIQLYDVFGREVYNGQSITDKVIINLSQLTAGNYILQLKSADGERVINKIAKE